MELIILVWIFFTISGLCIMAFENLKEFQEDIQTKILKSPKQGSLYFRTLLVTIF